MSNVAIPALVAAVVTASGWLVTHALSVRADRRRKILESRLAHVEQQLKCLYGPLAFMAYEDEAAFRDFLRILGRSYVFPADGKISEQDLELWLFWVDNNFMPRNEERQKLLVTNAHLIAGDELPNSWVAFVNYYNSWKTVHLRWKLADVPYSWRAGDNYPDEFNDNVIATFKSLRRIQSQLIGEISRRNSFLRGPQAGGDATTGESVLKRLSLSRTWRLNRGGSPH